MKRILIANRGEIALRIVRACHEEGLEAVAVYSAADRSAPFVRAADVAVPIGGAAPADSYLNIPRLIEAARAAGAEAVHPGYGFLAERAAFADAVTGAGLVWIGPPASAIRAMGDKTEARRRMQAAGVPVVPGAVEPVTDPAEALRLAREIGLPVMVKAAAGGGGKGMRVVREEGELGNALRTAASEALKAFGDAGVYLEKFIERPRHVEIQVLADGHGRTIHLGERECSVQRRHQKVVEEAPSVAVTPELRERMGAAAVAAARAVDYRGAGTCEFLLAADGSFYFLEMNTRIQVEHPVTELVYGVDLVREQLRVARGLALSVRERPEPAGWAMECRITSEDPANGFLPSTGRVEYLRIPSGPGVRWDAGVEVGDEVTLHYDSMIAKLIVWGADREAAMRRMERALDELVLVGVATNQGFHRRLLADPDFRRGAIDIQFLDRRQDLVPPRLDDAALVQVAIAAAVAEDESRRSRRPLVSVDDAAGSRWAQAGRLEGLR
jgi:acetyl-CoA carboxylase biotin carboxylase subunit